MVEQFNTDDAADVAVVGKFAEKGTGGASAGIFGIDGIAEVGYDGKGVNGHEQPFAQHLIPTLGRK